MHRPSVGFEEPHCQYVKYWHSVADEINEQRTHSLFLAYTYLNPGPHVYNAVYTLVCVCVCLNILPCCVFYTKIILLYVSDTFLSWKKLLEQNPPDPHPKKENILLRCCVHTLRSVEGDVGPVGYSINGLGPTVVAGIISTAACSVPS